MEAPVISLPPSQSELAAVKLTDCQTLPHSQTVRLSECRNFTTASLSDCQTVRPSTTVCPATPRPAGTARPVSGHRLTMGAERLGRSPLSRVSGRLGGSGGGEGGLAASGDDWLEDWWRMTDLQLAEDDRLATGGG